jgi:hypothetical protein
MRRLQCILSGILGLVIALLMSLVGLIFCLIVISVWISRGSEGEVGWDPVSLARQRPVIGTALLVIFIGFQIFGFARGYRFRARRISRAGSLNP